jgi:subtilisin-like proprotein convertase family protein
VWWWLLILLFINDVASAQTTVSTFSNNTVNAVPSSGPAAIYPSDITVAGVEGVTYHVSVTLNISHTFPGDLDILLVGPGGAVVLVADVGSGGDWANTDIVLDDCASRSMRNVSSIGAGRYRPQNETISDTPFTAPAPAGPYGNGLFDFNWVSPNGTWSLYVVDDLAGFSGTINSWNLKIFSQPASASFPAGGINPVTCSKPDYDGDGRADIAVYRPQTGTWFISGSGSGGALFLQIGWGAPASTGAGDVDVPGDYDGDGQTDVAVYRQSTGVWFVRQTFTGSLLQVSFGAPSSTGLGDTPVPADYDGDGADDIAVYRSTTGQWFIRSSAGFGPSVTNWGFPGAGDNPAR